MELPCASLESATRQVWCSPSKVTITSGFAATEGAASGALADGPQPVSHKTIDVEASTARRFIMVGDLFWSGAEVCPEYSHKIRAHDIRRRAFMHRIQMNRAKTGQTMSPKANHKAKNTAAHQRRAI
jgi:hypothetical protein